MTTTAAIAAKKAIVVSTEELLGLAEWERKYAKATKDTSVAKKELEFRRQKLAEVVLGVNSSDELKALSPGQVAKRGAERLEDGDWKPERGAPTFAFEETSHGSYPAWKELFIEEMGATAAAEISRDTPVVHSYSVKVTVPAV
jgi:hypothetical protein